MKRLLKTFVFTLLISFQGLYAFNEVPGFLIDYHVYQIWFTSGFHFFNFNEKSTVDRLDNQAYDITLTPHVAGKYKMRYLSLAFKGSLETRVNGLDKKRNWTTGIGDMDAYLFHCLNNRQVVGGQIVFPTASSKKGFGSGAYQVGACYAAHWGLFYSGEAFYRYAFKNQNHFQPGWSSGATLSYEDLITAALSFTYQNANRSAVP